MMNEQDIDKALETIQAVVKRYKEDVSRPGKYQGEKPYVVYFNERDWEADIISDDTDGESIRVWEIVPEDVLVFPELAGKKEMYIHVSPDGFVSQTNEAQYAAFEKMLEERHEACRCGENMDMTRTELSIGRREGKELVGRMFQCPNGHLTWWGEESQ